MKRSKLFAGGVLALSLTLCLAEAGSELAIRNQRLPFPQLLTAGQPTQEDLIQAAALGYRTVINLRTPGEQGELADEEQVVREAGMDYIVMPIGGPDDINRENAEKLAKLLEADVLPAIVHCASSNRVGALFALKAFHLDGKSAEEALEIGKSAGMTRLEAVVRQQLEAAR
jgi:uncharacterized protein (TIGR01244 family)